MKKEGHLIYALFGVLGGIVGGIISLQFLNIFSEFFLFSPFLLSLVIAIFPPRLFKIKRGIRRGLWGILLPLSIIALFLLSPFFVESCFREETPNFFYAFFLTRELDYYFSSTFDFVLRLYFLYSLLSSAIAIVSFALIKAIKKKREVRKCDGQSLPCETI